MPFDYRTAQKVSQAPGDLRKVAQNDEEMRRRMVTERAREWYRNYMGREPGPIQQPQITQPQAMPHIPAMPLDPMGQEVRGILAQLRQRGVIA